MTGAGSGYSAGWWEVSDHLMTIPLGGWDPVVTAMNMDKWDSLTPEMQKFITDEVKPSSKHRHGHRPPTH